ASANQDEFSDKIWPFDGELLRDEAADRKSESVELLNAQRVDEGSCVVGHLFNRSRNFTARAGDAGVVEQDHFAVLGKSVGQCGIPVIHGPREVHKEEQRHASFLAKATVSEANAGGLNELGRRSLVRVGSHKRSPSEGGPRISRRSFLRPQGWRRQSCTKHLPKRQ